MLLSSLVFSSAYCITSNSSTSLDNTNFMIMSDTCWVSPEKSYGCSYISQLLTIDPDSMMDIKTVCDDSTKSGYIISDLASLINSRLSQFGLSICHLTVMKGYEDHQLKDQCPDAYKQNCNYIRIV